MPRPIWTGAISFGLLNIPVQLMPAERRVDLQFHMLDSRDGKRVRYERVNAETGEEVPWADVVKAFEYSKGSYVVLEEDDLKAAAPQSKESVDIERFITPDELSFKYFDRPYYLVPMRKAEKGYVLLRDTLHKLGRIGLARVVIRTREYLAALMPEDRALVLILLRFPQELVPASDYALPEGASADYRIGAREQEMARQLVDSMTARFKPAEYRDEFRERLVAVIKRRTRGKKRTTAPELQEAEAPAGTANVVDFMALLKKSIAENRRTPAAKSTAKPARKSAEKAQIRTSAPKTRPASRKRATRRAR